jgi:hypothetical protein
VPFCAAAEPTNRKPPKAMTVRKLVIRFVMSI